MRRASVEISIQGKDVSMDLWPHLLSLSYVDKADDELDDLQLTLEDREGLWQGDWLPKHGDIISVTIVASNFRAPGEEELDCGEFEVDELTLETSRDGGDVVTIKGVPAAVKSSLMLQKKTRAWADVPLSTVAADVVGPAGLDLLYKAPEIVYGRVEQRQEADLAFLQRICKEQGLRVAVKKNLCVIYSGQAADQLEPLELKRGELAVERAGFKRTLDGVYTQWLHRCCQLRDHGEELSAGAAAHHWPGADHQQAHRASGAGRARGHRRAAGQKLSGDDRIL